MGSIRSQTPSYTLCSFNYSIFCLKTIPKVLNGSLISYFHLKRTRGKTNDAISFPMLLKVKYGDKVQFIEICDPRSEEFSSIVDFINCILFNSRASTKY